jgi:SanA protein
MLVWGIALILLLISPRLVTTFTQNPHIKSIDQVSPTRYGVILAAETTPQGRPSAVLKDRIQRGVDLYLAGKVSQLVMSGRAPEPAIMRDYAVSLGVSQEDIVLDNGGIRTYATCYIAANQLDIKEAIFITQPYHLPRTLYLCQALGIDATGVAALHGRYWRGSWLVWNIRETLATILAFQELYLNPPDTTQYISLFQEGIHQ